MTSKFGASKIDNPWQRIGYLNKHKKAVKEALNRSTNDLFDKGNTNPYSTQEIVSKAV